MNDGAARSTVNALRVYNYISLSRRMAIWHRQFALLTNRPEQQTNEQTNERSKLSHLQFICISTLDTRARQPTKYLGANSAAFRWQQTGPAQQRAPAADECEQMARENRDRPRGHRVADDKRNRDAAIKLKADPPIHRTMKFKRQARFHSKHI